MRRAPKVPPLLVLGVAAGTAWLIDRMAGPSLPTPGFQVAGALVASLGVGCGFGGYDNSLGGVIGVFRR